MTVRKRGSRWWYDFRLRGIRYREPIPEAQTKAEALQAEAKIRSDLFGGRYGGIRLTPVLTDWINDTYLPTGGRPLDYPIYAYAGDADPIAAPDDVAGWRLATTAPAVAALTIATTSSGSKLISSGRPAWTSS